MHMTMEWLGFAGMALCVLAYVPQTVHLIREHCSAGLSPGAYGMWLIAAVLLLTYAIVKRDPVFTSLQSYQVGASALVFYYCLKYRHQFCEEHGGEPVAVRLGKGPAPAPQRADRSRPSPS